MQACGIISLPSGREGGSRFSLPSASSDLMYSRWLAICCSRLSALPHLKGNYRTTR